MIDQTSELPVKLNIELFIYKYGPTHEEMMIDKRRGEPQFDYCEPQERD